LNEYILVFFLFIIIIVEKEVVKIIYKLSVL